MRQSMHFVASMAAAAAAMSLAAVPASAECKRFGFTVNDYGKDGPTRDAKDLLDKLITKTMADKGVKDYTSGKKSVSCELFLNFIVFDEHTCTAEASVCWGGSSLPNSERADAADNSDKAKSASDDEAPAKPVKKKKKDAVAAASETPSAVADKKPAGDKAEGDKKTEGEKKVVEKTAATEHHSKAKAVHVADPKPALKPVATEASSADGAAKANDKAGSTPGSETAKAEDSSVPAKPATPTEKTDDATKPQSSTADAVSPKASDKSGKSPVVTGSISEPTKKPVKHKVDKEAKSTDGGSGPNANGISSGSSSDVGYPTPLPPQPGDTPSP